MIESDFESRTLDTMCCHCRDDISVFFLFFCFFGMGTFLQIEVGFTNYFLRFQGGRIVHLLKTWALEVDGQWFKYWTHRVVTMCGFWGVI